MGFASPKVAAASRSEGNFHPKTKLLLAVTSKHKAKMIRLRVKFNKFRRSIFRLDEAVLNFMTGVTELVMTEQNLKPTKYK